MTEVKSTRKGYAGGDPAATRRPFRSQKSEILLRLCRIFVLSSVLCPLSSVYAAPPNRISATYDIYKGSMKVGRIEENFVRDNNRYTLTSNTKAVGWLAIFAPGKISRSSS